MRETVIEMKKSLKSSIVEDYHELPLVRADPEQLKKVIINLIINAEESVTGEGEIRVNTAVKNGKATFSVSDNGCGIAREFIEDGLFRSFSTTKASGFGIGLYQSKKIIEAHRGRIEVTSKVGRGSNFTVLLPIIQE